MTEEFDFPLFNGGLDLSSPADAIGMNFLRRAVNLVNDEDNVLVKRKGMSKVNATSISPGLGVHSQAIRSPTRYQAAGTAIYREFTQISTGYSGKMVGAVNAKPIRADRVFTFFADSNKMEKDDGTTVTKWGISPPGTALTAAGGGPGNVNGTVTYKVVFYRAYGSLKTLSNDGPESASVTVSGQFVNLSNIPTSPDPQVTGRLIYRKGGTLTKYQRVLDIGNNTTTTAVDNTSDANAGDLLETDNDVPPLGRWPVLVNDRIWLIRDSDSALVYSKAKIHESFPSSNFLTVESPGDPPLRIFAFQGVIYVFTKRKVFIIATPEAVITGLPRGEDVFAPLPLDAPTGIAAEGSVAASSLGVYYLGSDHHVYRVNFRGTFEDVSLRLRVPLEGTAVEALDAINPAQVSKAVGAFFRGRYYLSIATGASTENSVTLVYDEATRQWFQDSRGFKSFLVDGTKLYGGKTTDGFVFDLTSDALSDDGAPIDFDFQTGAFTGSDPTVEKYFPDVYVDLDTSGADVTVVVLMNLGASLITESVRARGRTKIVIPVGITARDIAIRIVGSSVGPVKVFRVGVRFLVEARPRRLLDTKELLLAAGRLGSVRRLVLEFHAFSPLTLEVFVDGVAVSTQSIAPAAERTTKRILLNSLHIGRSFRIKLSSTRDFQVYALVAWVQQHGADDYQQIDLTERIAA
jgi:hypothetical protein